MLLSFFVKGQEDQGIVKLGRRGGVAVLENVGIYIYIIYIYSYRAVDANMLLEG